MQVEGFIVPVPTIIETLWFWGTDERWEVLGSALFIKPFVVPLL